MKSTRTYTQTKRAAAAEATRQRIMAAAFELQSERLSAEISLDDVAERAGVSVQTVLRRFGSRAGLFDATVAWANAQIVEERRTPPGEIEAAMKVLVDHYEKRGDMSLMLLAQESTYPHVRKLSETGKHLHRTWVAEVFADHLSQLAAAAREEALDLLVVATDVYTWKLMRRDRGHSRAQTEHRMSALVSAVLAATGATPATTNRKDT